MKKIILIIFGVIIASLIGLNFLNADVEIKDSAQYFPAIEKKDFCNNENCLVAGNTKSFAVEKPTGDEYNLIIEYVPSTEFLQEDQIEISFPGFKEKLILDKRYVYANEEVQLDRYGNEIIGVQASRQEKIKMNVNEKLGIDSFSLSQDITQVELTNVSNDIEITDVSLAPATEISKTVELIKEDNSAESDQIVVEGENFAYKNDSSIAIAYVSENTVTPKSTESQQNNVIKGATFNEGGQTITYVFEIENAGYYTLNFNGQNQLAKGKDVYMDVRINGEIPSATFKEAGVPTESAYKLYQFNEPIYLKAGQNTLEITLKTNMYDELIAQTREATEIIDEIEVEMQKVTGGITDENRSWQLTKYIPNLKEQISQLDEKLANIKSGMDELFEQENELTNGVDLMLNNLHIIEEDLDNLPNYKLYFSEGTTSIRGLLATLKADLLKSDYSLDKIIIVPISQEVEIFQPNIGNDLAYTTSKLANSFVTSEETGEKKYNQEIDIWVKRPRQYVDVMQKMVDEQFTPETNIKVNFSLLTDQNKLTMANAAGLTPDVAMSLDTWYIYQIALRGGLYDFTDQPQETANTIKTFAPGGLNQLIIDQSIYGIPETQDFFVLYYRKDIFNEYGYQVPNTWTDVTELLPRLQSQGFDFYIPLSSASSLKTLPTTGSFFLQNGVNIYADDGLTVDLTSEKQQKSLEFMTNLYTIYGMEKQIPNFYDSFRDGTVPIGISNFATYVQLMYAAPEIADDWAIMPVPGIENAAGTINRTMPGGTGAQGSVVFERTEHSMESLKFLRWWNSTKVQAEYTEQLISSYGGEYIWNSSNLEAFQTLPIPEEDKEVFAEQAKWVYDIPLTSANYYVERGVSDIWNKAVFSGESVRVESEYQETIINQELEKRYQEFGYINEEGETIKSYYIPTIDDTKRWIEENE